VTTFTDGAPPSVTPEPDDGSVPHRAEPPDPDAGAAWLHDEIQRRIAEGAAAGGGGRHARRGEPSPSGSAGYVPRHSVATPGPGAPRPGPVGGQMSQASELLRRERTEATTAQPVWSGPPVREVGPQPPPAAATPGPVRPGVAAAAAMRGAAAGRARAAAAAAPPAAPAPPAAAPPRPEPAGTTPADPSATAPVETAAVETAPVEAVLVETAHVETAQVPAAPAEQAPAEEVPPAPAPADAAPVAAPPVPDVQPTGPLPVAPPASDEVPADTEASQAPEQAPEAPEPVVPEPDATELTAPVPAVPAATDSPPHGIRVPEQRGAAQRTREQPRPEEPRSEEPTPQESKRVRVVLAERKGVARPVRTVITIQESSGVGELLRRNLIGSQLAIALRFAIGAGLTLGLLPLLFAMVPEIGRVEVLGIRLPWLLLGVLVYPFLFGLGLWHTRTAEHLEQNFAETVQD
jgi:hypothetical protein